MFNTFWFLVKVYHKGIKKHDYYQKYMGFLILAKDLTRYFKQHIENTLLITF